MWRRGKEFRLARRHWSLSASGVGALPLKLAMLALWTVANPEAIFTVHGKYFVYVGADRELLRKLGFRFWD
jgi:hypothetical protein